MKDVEPLVAYQFQQIGEVAEVRDEVRGQILFHRTMLEEEQFALVPARLQRARQRNHEGFDAAD